MIPNFTEKVLAEIARMANIVYNQCHQRRRLEKELKVRKGTRKNKPAGIVVFFAGLCHIFSWLVGLREVVSA